MKLCVCVCVCVWKLYVCVCVEMKLCACVCVCVLYMQAYSYSLCVFWPLGFEPRADTPWLPTVADQLPLHHLPRLHPAERSEDDQWAAQRAALQHHQILLQRPHQWPRVLWILQAACELNEDGVSPCCSSFWTCYGSVLWFKHCIQTTLFNFLQW